MKKFLCYDTNDAASGKIGVNSNGVLSPNATVPSTNGTPYQQLVTDGDGNAKWEDRLAYDKKTVLVEQTTVTNGGIQSSINPSLLVNGTPVTVNIDGTEYNATLEEGGTYYVGSYTNTCYYHIGGSASIDTNVPSHMSTTYYPFFVVIYEDGNCMVLFDGEVAGTEHTFGVYAGETKQIDPKYIKDMYYDNLQSASYDIYTGGLTEFPRSELDIPLEMWKLLLDENATITDETTGSVMTNRTVVGSAAGERVCYSTGIPGISSLFISTMYPQAYLVVSSAPDDRLGEKRTIKVSIGTIKKIDQKFIPNMTVIVNITDNEDGTYSADKTYDEIKSLIDSGIDVKCMYNSTIANYVGFNEEVSVMAFELTSFAADGVSISIFFIPDSISVNFTTLEKKLLPEVSTSDNNKFLSVVNGTWQASSDLIVPSSTSGSSKKFKITVDDSGAITATEV